MSVPAPQWLTVDDVAAELRLTHRCAWELVKTLGVPVVGPFRQRSKLARFRRADWDAALTRSLRPVVEPRALPAPVPASASDSDATDELGAWREVARRRVTRPAPPPPA